MAVSFKNRINRDLLQLARRKRQVMQKSLLVAGEVLAEELEVNTPKQTARDGQIDRKTRASHAHLKTNVVYNLEDDHQDDAKVLIGYTEDVAWRVHFVELGTIKQKPQGFMERTTNENMPRATNILERELRRRLGFAP